jgi:hypothetical protein
LEDNGTGWILPPLPFRRLKGPAREKKLTCEAVKLNLTFYKSNIYGKIFARRCRKDGAKTVVLPRF